MVDCLSGCTRRRWLNFFYRCRISSFLSCSVCVCVRVMQLKIKKNRRCSNWTRCRDTYRTNSLQLQQQQKNSRINSTEKKRLLFRLVRVKYLVLSVWSCILFFFCSLLSLSLSFHVRVDNTNYLKKKHSFCCCFVLFSTCVVVQCYVTLISVSHTVCVCVCVKFNSNAQLTRTLKCPWELMMFASVSCALARLKKQRRQ